MAFKQAIVLRTDLKMGKGNKKYWNKQYLKQQLVEGKNYLKLARENKIGKSTIQRALHHHNLTNNYSYWQENEISVLKKL